MGILNGIIGRRIFSYYVVNHSKSRIQRRVDIVLFSCVLISHINSSFSLRLRFRLQQEMCKKKSRAVELIATIGGLRFLGSRAKAHICIHFDNVHSKWAQSHSHAGAMVSFCTQPGVKIYPSLHVPFVYVKKFTHTKTRFKIIYIYMINLDFIFSRNIQGSLFNTFFQ